MSPYLRGRGLLDQGCPLSGRGVAMPVASRSARFLLPMTDWSDKLSPQQARVLLMVARTKTKTTEADELRAYFNR